MHHSKVIELLRSFPARAWRRFGDFLLSPFFNKNTDIPAFYRHLDRYYPEFTHPDLNKTVVLQKPFLDKPLNSKSLSYLMSRLQELAELFLAVEAVEGDERQRGLLLAKSLRNAGLSKQASSVLEKLKRENQKAAHGDEAFLRFQFDLSALEYELSDNTHKHRYHALLQQNSDRLDAWYFAQKLRLMLGMANLEQMVSERHSPLLALEVTTAVENGAWLDIPVIALYYYGLNMTRQDDSESFEMFLSLLNKHIDLFNPVEQKHLYTNALNFCIRRINRHNEGIYYRKYLEINEDMLKRGLLFDGGELSPWRYLNLTNAGLYTGQWQWTWDFIQTWRHKLPPDYAASLYQYNLAQWHYAQKNYDTARQALALVEFQDIMLSLAARSLLIKIYVETDETELLFSALEAARIFLLRAEKIEPKRRRQMQQFIDFTRRFAKIDPPDPVKLAALLEKMPLASELMHRDWLAAEVRKKLGVP